MPVPRVDRETAEVVADQAASRAVERTMGVGAPLTAAVSHGTGLDASMRAEMEAGFGHNFGAVRIHSDAGAGSAVRALHARAFTRGNDIHFAPGAYAPGTPHGRHLIAHELAHVVQQGGRAPSGTTPDRSGERSAHDAASRVAAGGRAQVSPRAAAGPQLQDDAGAVAPTTDDGDPVDVITGGLKTVGSELVKNAKVKKELVEPVAKAVGGRAQREWGSLGTGEKAGLVAFGAGSAGLVGGALLSDPRGRRLFEGVNLAAPLGIVPYATLKTFVIAPAGGAGAGGLYKVETGFDLTDVLKLGGDRLGWKGLSLTAELKWDYDPKTETLSLAGGTGKIGVLPGLSLSGGTYPNLLQPRRLVATDTGFVESKQSLPAGPKAAGTPDVRVMVTFDLMKFAESGIVPGLGEAFGYSKKKAR